MKHLKLLSVLFLFISLSCVDRHSIEFTPNNITVDSNAHTIIFSTDHPLVNFRVVERETDYSEITEEFDNETRIRTIRGDWFTLKGRLYSSQIELYIDANEGEDRSLSFYATRAGGLAHAAVIQLGKK